MVEELLKRLEEATEKYADSQVNIGTQGLCRIEGFLVGAKYGYKEAVAMAKEWIQKNVPIIHTEEGDYVRVNMGHKNVPMNKYLADFETGMNKLWEGKKDA